MHLHNMTISLVPYRRNLDWDVIQVHLWQAAGVLENKLIIDYSKTPLILYLKGLKKLRDKDIEVKIHKSCVWSFLHKRINVTCI